MNRLAVFLLMATAWLIAGCSKPGIVGTWTFQQGQMNIEQTFNADNTFNQRVFGDTPVGKLELKVSGKYALKGDDLTMSGAKVDSMTGVPKEQEARVRQAVGAQFAKDQTGKIEFKNDNELSINVQGQQLTMKRKS